MGGLADAARCSGSHSLYSHHWDSDWTQQPCTGGEEGKNKEINKPSEKNLSPVQIVSQTSCLFVTKSKRRFADIHGLRSKVGHEGGTETAGWFKSPPSSFFPLLFQQKIDFFFFFPWKLFKKRLLCRWLAQREPLSPVHGNERCAINWAWRKGGAQQQGCGC